MYVLAACKTLEQSAWGLDAPDQSLRPLHTPVGSKRCES